MTSFNRVQRRRIGEILVDQGLVSKEDIEEALRIQRKTNETLGTILVDMGCVTDIDITKTIVMQYQFPYISLDNYQISEKLCELFPAEFLYHNKILPFDEVGDMLLCAVAEVPREETLAEIPRMTQRKAALYVSCLGEVNRYLEKLSPLPEEVLKEIQENRKRGASSKKKGGKRAAPKGGPGAPKIFEEESSEAILEALDSTWDSIFDVGGALGGGDEEPEGGGEGQGAEVVEDNS